MLNIFWFPWVSLESIRFFWSRQPLAVLNGDGFTDHFAVVATLRAQFVLCLTVSQVGSAATGRVDNLKAVGFLALHVAVKLAHDFVPLGDVAFHASILQSISARVNPLGQVFFEIFFGLFFSGLAQGLLGQISCQNFGTRFAMPPPLWGVAAAAHPPGEGCVPLSVRAYRRLV